MRRGSTAGERSRESSRSGQRKPSPLRKGKKGNEEEEEGEHRPRRGERWVGTWDEKRSVRIGSEVDACILCVSPLGCSGNGRGGEATPLAEADRECLRSARRVGADEADEHGRGALESKVRGGLDSPF